MAKVLCTRNGCNQQFTEEDNTDDSCRFHPGVPVFHEGLKGWSCCPKRMTNFDDFLNYPGCAWGRHTDVNPRRLPNLPPPPTRNWKVMATPKKSTPIPNSAR
eukprot:TRINITY_DN2311_c0_g1_i1.p2 TRINITY_DN2311_c0_g1~~TRINITY_DN2311_c0_g1_i1.p2  ORF type:complete len:102 (-),score=16.74 TRINITY_DN2311_c0_g1_i1:621-926(-)